MDRKIAYQGELDLNGFKISCYVLEDGTRVLSARGMQESLKMVDDVDDGKQKSGTRLLRYLDQKSLDPFIYREKTKDHFQPITCYIGKRKINGYEATVLADICDAFLEARKNIHLSPRQEKIAEQCEILIRSFARVGIVALVDEATGYQYDREKDELQKILKAYISKELLPRQKRFPDEFYTELFRLNGRNFTVQDIKKKPWIVGRRTNELIYKQLPPGVLEELKKQTPKTEKGNHKARFHQSLTQDVGEPNLQKQIIEVITLFRLSNNMEQMRAMFENLKLRKLGQYPLPFKFDEKGHTVEPIEEKNLSDFNKKLLKGIEYNLKSE